MRLLPFAKAEKKQAVNVSEKALVKEQQIGGDSGLQEDEQGYGIAEWREMLLDPQVKAATSLKRLARLSSGWDIEPASSEAADIEVADFVRDQLSAMEGTANGFMNRAMRALDFGLSVHEIVYQYVEDGKWSGKVGLKKLAWRKPETFRIKTDKFGNIEALEQEQGSSNWKKLDPSYFILWAYDHEGDYVGRSQLRPAYEFAKAKKLIDSRWNLFVERHAIPTPVGRHPANASKPEKESVLDFLSKITGRKAAVIPMDWELTLIEANGAGEAFEMRLGYCDRMIARAVLLPTLMLDEGSRGTQALGKAHSETFRWVLEALGEVIAEEVVGKQLIQRIVDYNYDVEMYPRLVFRPVTKDGWKDLVDAMCSLVNIGIVDVEEPVVRARLDLPPRADDALDPQSNPATGSDDDDDGKEPAQKKPAKTPPSNDGAGSDKAPGADGAYTSEDRPLAGHDSRSAPCLCTQTDEPERPAQTILARPGQSAIRQEKTSEELAAELRHGDKADFSAIEQTLDRIEGEGMARVASAFEQMRDSAIYTLRQKRIVERQQFNAIDSIRFKGVGDLRDALNDAMGEAILIGTHHAMQELDRGLAAVGAADRPRYRRTTKINLTAPEFEHVSFSLRDMIEEWTGKVPIQKAQLAQYTRQSFTMAGAYNDKLLADAQAIIRRGMVRGASQRQIEAQLRSMFEPYVLTGEADLALVSANRIQTIIRTNVAEAYNTARMNLYRDPEVVGFVKAYEFSAVVDNRTTEVCRAFHGAVVEEGSVELTWLLPPLHYKCRSVLIPIVKGEKYDIGSWRERNGEREWVKGALPNLRPAPGFEV